MQAHLEPWLNSVLGWIPLFSGDPSPVGMLPAILILALMMLPIITSISREVLLTAPRDMRDGALALGVTRWEMIRGIVLPYARPGIAAAMMLGLARALGEAIAVTQVIGSATGIHVSLFGPSDTLGEPHREPVPGRDEQPAGGCDRLPRRDPARDRARRERLGATDRRELRARRAAR